jgi:cytochrome P450
MERRQRSRGRGRPLAPLSPAPPASFAQQLFARYADEVAAATAMAIEGIADERMPLDFERTMTDLTTAVICRTMFGTDLGK